MKAKKHTFYITRLNVEDYEVTARKPKVKRHPRDPDGWWEPYYTIEGQRGKDFCGGLGDALRRIIGTRLKDGQTIKVSIMM